MKYEIGYFEKCLRVNYFFYLLHLLSQTNLKDFEDYKKLSQFPK